MTEPNFRALCEELIRVNDDTEAGDWCRAWDDVTDRARAALRAAGDTLSHPTSAHTLYAIADELEGIKYGTYRCDLEDKPQ